MLQGSTTSSAKAWNSSRRGQELYADSHPDAPRGFALRVTKNERRWILNYTTHSAQRRYTLPLGYPDWGPARARKEANDLRTKILAGIDPLTEKENARAAAERAKAEAARTADAEKARREHTLGALLEAYASQLETQGKESFRDVRSLIRNHVRDAHRQFWNIPASEIQPEDGVDILSTITNAGSLRTAGKLRSYMRAAYSSAIRSRLLPGASAELRAFGIRANPMIDLPTIEGGAGKPRERALVEAELRAYWQRIATMGGADGALLRLHLLTGGQRIKQLFRATVSDYDRDARTIFLRDKKGRRSEARVHGVPLVPAAVEALEELHGKDGPYLISLDRGETPASYDHLNVRLCRVVDAMIEHNEIAERFTPGDLRRTVETRLAAKVSKEVRAQLQSHGLSGVQARHYDRYEYADEKRAALETLYALLTGKAAKVTTLHKRRVA